VRTGLYFCQLLPAFASFVSLCQLLLPRCSQVSHGFDAFCCGNYHKLLMLLVSRIWRTPPLLVLSICFHSALPLLWPCYLVCSCYRERCFGHKGADNVIKYESAPAKFRVSCKTCGCLIHNILPNSACVRVCVCVCVCVCMYFVCVRVWVCTGVLGVFANTLLTGYAHDTIFKTNNQVPNATLHCDTIEIQLKHHWNTNIIVTPL
jgi:hypothetical protein